MDPIWVYLISIFCGLVGLEWLLKKTNSWIYESRLGDIKNSLPPGDLGWPFIGNMRSFLKAFKTTTPDSFVNSYITKYGRTGIYKAHMFGKPSVIVTLPETCRKALTDDDNFQPGWPKSTLELIGRKSFVSIPYEEHKRLRRLTMAPINGHEALSVYLEYIEDIVISGLEKWSKMGEIEYLTQVRKLTFKIIMHIFLGTESENIMDALEKEYTSLNYGVRAMAVNLPGFAYHRALKARKNLVAILQSTVTERRNLKKKSVVSSRKKDMMDHLIEAEDENGRRLDDEEIIDILIMYLNAGHESSGHTIMWATVFLQAHPEILQKAREEQLNIIKKRPATQKGLTLKEIREMEYLSKVIDETMRIITFSLVVFREAKNDVKLGDYMVPKGWKVLVWFRAVHLDDQIYANPREFNPSRWDNFTPKAGSFIPFGGGTRLCPGNDLAKLEISIYLHHFLLNYQMERLNPNSPTMYLPHSRPTDNCRAIIKKRSSI